PRGRAGGGASGGVPGEVRGCDPSPRLHRGRFREGVQRRAADHPDAMAELVTTSRDARGQHGTVRPIRLLGDPVLRTPTDPVTAFDDALRRLVEDMFASMYAAEGVGLAANQI